MFKFLLAGAAIVSALAVPSQFGPGRLDIAAAIPQMIESGRNVPEGRELSIRIEVSLRSTRGPARATAR